MVKWLTEFYEEFDFFVRHLIRLAGGGGKTLVGKDNRIVFWCTAGSLILLAGVVVFVSRGTPALVVEPVPIPISKAFVDVDLSVPVREEPRRFKARTHLPNKSERAASGALDAAAFFPKFDLVRVEDTRVWWESEHDRDDTEDDHIMHRSIEEPLRRLIELIDQAGGTLKVQDAYRPTGIHALRSLHREGRAIDLTCDDLGLEKLAKLSWAAGFDWVYYEAPKRGGTHVHCSVQAER